jgi:predicted RNase H-like nuclease (RuvC/YqgF family)
MKTPFDFEKLVSNHWFFEDLLKESVKSPIHFLEALVKDVHSQITSAREDAKDEVAEDIKELESEALDLEERISELTNELCAEKGTTEELDAKCYNLEQELDEMKSNNAQLLRDIEAKEERIMELETEVKEQRLELDKLNTYISDLEKNTRLS